MAKIIRAQAKAPAEDPQHQASFDILQRELMRRRYFLNAHNHQRQPIQIEDHYSDAWTFHFIRDNRSRYEFAFDIEPILMLFITKLPAYHDYHYFPARRKFNLTRGASKGHVRNPFPGVSGLSYAVSLMHIRHEPDDFQLSQRSINIKDFWTN